MPRNRIQATADMLLSDETVNLSFTSLKMPWNMIISDETVNLKCYFLENATEYDNVWWNS
jgi:hypothetical protein